jgi:serine/threonine protein kinase
MEECGVPETQEPTRLWSLVEAAIARWRDGEPPDAAAFLERHPEIASRKAMALELIEEELGLRQEAGESVVPKTFIARFRDYHSSIRKVLEIHAYGEQNPDFLAALGEQYWPKLGESFQGFEIVEPLGEGSFARVYLARETAMGGRPVVVKVAQHGGHEAHLLGKLEHPNIVAAHSVKHDAETGLTVICMPLLGTATGLDLLDMAFRERTPRSAEVIVGAARRFQPEGMVKAESLREAFAFSRRTYVEGIAWLGKELAAGLAMAGDLQVAHGDIKPSNVLLAWSGRPMLLDFNLSFGAKSAEQIGDVGGGTLAYMAPERIEMLLTEVLPDDAPFDARLDVFSLGAVLYELLTGRLPAAPRNALGNDQAAYERWLDCRQQAIAPPSRFNPDVDPPIDRIVLKCLAADPAERYAGGADLSADLSAYLGPAPTGARWARRNRRRLLAAGLAGATFLAAGGGYWITRPPLHELNYRAGLDRYDAGDYRGAIAALDQSLRDNPQSVKALFARGQSYYRNGDLPSAQRDYIAAATIEPRGLFWFCAACCALNKAEGLDYLATAMRRGHDKAEVFCNVGVCLGRDSHTVKDSLAAYGSAIEANPRLLPARVGRASHNILKAYNDHDQKALENALADLEAAEPLEPKTKRFYYLAAMAHTLNAERDSGSWKRAQGYFREMRLRDKPAATYDQHFLLHELLARYPDLKEAAPPHGSIPEPDLPLGVPPPEPADLSPIDAH